MGNTIQIKNGSSVPKTNQLSPYELGYVQNGALYINNNGKIVQLTDPNVINLINSDNKITKHITLNDATLVINNGSYGYQNPNVSGISGTKGQLYFQIIVE